MFFFLLVFRLKFCMYFLSLLCVLNASAVSPSFIWSSSSLAKQSFLSHSLPYEIMPNVSVKIDHPVFTSLDFARTIFLWNKAINPESTPQPGGPGLCIYVPPVISPGTGFPFRLLLRFARLRWRTEIVKLLLDFLSFLNSTRTISIYRKGYACNLRLYEGRRMPFG
jgi:hypothetical protein